MKNLLRLPGLTSYESKLKHFLPFETTEIFLGNNFYVRIHNIYLNLLKAIEDRNYKYLTEVIENKALREHLIHEIQFARQNRYRIKMNDTKNKFIYKSQQYEKLKKFLRLRQTIWKNDITKIGVACNVHFGQQFCVTKVDELKRFHVNRYRYVYYDNRLNIMENIRKMYEHQTFQFLIKIRSKAFLEGYNFEKERVNVPENDEIVTEIKLKSGNVKFNWLITDINGISSSL